MSVLEAGKKLRESAAREAEAARLRAVNEAKQSKHDVQGPSRPQSGQNAAQTDIPSEDMSFVMQFPYVEESSQAQVPPFLASSDALRAKITSRYGPLDSAVLLAQGSGVSGKPPSKKQKKPKGPLALVEFLASNKDGCWAFWKDHTDGAAPRSLVPGVKVHFGARKDGSVPDWVAKLDQRDPIRRPKTPSTQQGVSVPEASNASNQANGSTTDTLSSSSGILNQASSSRPSIPPLGSTTGLDFLGGNKPSMLGESTSRHQSGDDSESNILHRMRQQERAKLEAEIRKQEEESDR